MRHVHGRIVRIRLPQPAGDLLRRPLARELGRHGVSQRRVRGQATALGAPTPFPRPAVSLRGPIPVPAAVPPHFATHRRGGAPQPASNGAQRAPVRQPPRDLLALGQCQCEARALPRRWGQAARPGHDVMHDPGNPAQRAADGRQRFPLAPAAPHLRLLRRRQSRATRSHHETSMFRLMLQRPPERTTFATSYSQV